MNADAIREPAPTAVDSVVQSNPCHPQPTRCWKWNWFAQRFTRGNPASLCPLPYVPASQPKPVGWLQCDPQRSSSELSPSGEGWPPPPPETLLPGGGSWRTSQMPWPTSQTSPRLRPRLPITKHRYTPSPPPNAPLGCVSVGWHTKVAALRLAWDVPLLLPPIEGISLHTSVNFRNYPPGRGF